MRLISFFHFCQFDLKEKRINDLDTSHRTMDSLPCCISKFYFLMWMLLEGPDLTDTVVAIWSGQTRRSLFLCYFWTKILLDNWFETVLTFKTAEDGFQTIGCLKNLLVVSFKVDHDIMMVHV